MNLKFVLEQREFLKTLREGKDDVKQQIASNKRYRFKEEELPLIQEKLGLTDEDLNQRFTDRENGYIIINMFNSSWLPMEYFDLLEDNIITFVMDKYLKPADKSFVADFMEKWEYGKALQRVVITHDKCHDGYGTAAAVKYHAETILRDNHVDGEIEYIYTNYGQYDIHALVEQLEGKLVYVGDFSFKPEEYEILEKSVNDILTVDHHESAFNSTIGDKINVHLDMTMSGTLLTWLRFFPKESNVKTPLAIKLISDRDLYRFFYGNYSKAFYLMVNAEGPEVITEFMEKDDELVSILEDYIPVVVREEEKQIDKANDAQEFYINGIRFHAINLTSGVSDILNHVSRIFGTPSLGYSIKNGNIELAFRNYLDDIDVSKIAETYGGGGHKQASGAKVSVKNIDLYDFFVNNRLTMLNMNTLHPPKDYAKQFATNLKEKLKEE